MNKTFTKEFIRANLDCYNKQSKAFLPLANERLESLSDPVTLKDIFESNIRIEDKFWWLMVHTDITVPELQSIAKDIAEVAVRIYKAETGSDLLGSYWQGAKNGVNTEDQVKAMIKEGNDPISRSGNATKSVARSIAAQFTPGHKRPLAIKASQRLVFAGLHNEIYTGWINELLLSYGI